LCNLFTDMESSYAWFRQNIVTLRYVNGARVCIFTIPVIIIIDIYFVSLVIFIGQ